MHKSRFRYDFIENFTHISSECLGRCLFFSLYKSLSIHYFIGERKKEGFAMYTCKSIIEIHNNSCLFFPFIRAFEYRFGKKHLHGKSTRTGICNICNYNTRMVMCFHFKRQRYTQMMELVCSNCILRNMFIFLRRWYTSPIFSVNWFYWQMCGELVYFFHFVFTINM